MIQDDASRKFVGRAESLASAKKLARFTNVIHRESGTRMKPQNQIPDFSGHMFTPTSTQARLHKAGWRRYLSEKRGMIRRIHWVDPKTGDGHTQGTAFQILREREKFSMTWTSESGWKPK
jgi:hypothetical protein